MDNFREWLSDNLRYILLILAVLAVLAGLFFGIRFLSQTYAQRTAKADFSSDSIVDSAEAASAAVESKESVSSGTESVTVTPTATATPTPTATVTPTATATPTPTAEPTPVGGTLQKDAVPEVTNLVTQYYTALQNRDPDLMRTVVNNLAQDDAYKIADADETTYTDIAAYTKNGQEADSYLVYAYYKYQDAGTYTAMPGLSQLYAKKTEDGSYKIITDAYDSAMQAYVDSVNNSDDVKNLVAQVQTEYESAQAAEEDAKAQAEAQAAAEQQAAADAQKAAEEAAAQAAYEAEHKETPAHLNGTCNVRSGPGYEYGVIYPDLPSGTAVTVIGDTGAGWIHIRTDSVEGYVGGHFVSY